MGVVSSQGFWELEFPKICEFVTYSHGDTKPVTITPLRLFLLVDGNQPVGSFILVYMA